MLDVARYARQIALPEIGPEGQARISAARVAVVGTDLAAETAALYLRAAGVPTLIPLPAERGEGKGEGSGGKGEGSGGKGEGSGGKGEGSGGKGEGSGGKGEGSGGKGEGSGGKGEGSGGKGEGSGGKGEGSGGKGEGSGGKGEGSDAQAWREALANVDLVVRSGFDDDAMMPTAARLGLPVIVVRARPDGVDMVVFARRPPAPDATADAPVAAAAPPDDGPAAVLAGTLAAAEALHVLARGGEHAAPAPIRHLRLPLDGREPLVQEIGRRG